MTLASVVLMSICLGAEGVILLFSGVPFRGTPLLLDVVGIIWVLTCFSVFIFKRRPIFALAFGWLLFLVNASDMWFNSTEEKSLAWFLYQHCLELAFIAASGVGYIFIARARRETVREVRSSRGL